MLHLQEPLVKLEQNIQVLFSAPHLPKYLKGDPAKLIQILNNLVSNALKFTENGAVTIDVKIVSDTQGQPFLEFAIADTGIGIKPENLDKVFESFSQADQSTTRKFGGTGLGLPVVLSHDGAVLPSQRILVVLKLLKNSFFTKLFLKFQLRCLGVKYSVLSCLRSINIYSKFNSLHS